MGSLRRWTAVTVVAMVGVGGGTGAANACITAFGGPDQQSAAFGRAGLQDDGQGWAAAPSDTDGRRAAAYWTRDRMLGARPADGLALGGTEADTQAPQERGQWGDDGRR